MTSGAGATLTYDEANRISAATETSGGAAYYGYSPDNKRIYMNGGGWAEQWTFYGAKGEKLGVFGSIIQTAARGAHSVYVRAGGDECVVCGEADPGFFGGRGAAGRSGPAGDEPGEWGAVPAVWG